MTNDVQQNMATGPLRILHFTNSTLWGGVEEHICGLLRNLSKNQFRAQLVCDPAIYLRFRGSIPGDIDVTPLAFSSPKHLTSAIRFARMLVKGQIQIVHSHMFWSSLFASPIAWACRVPVIVETLHGTEAWRSGWKANNTLDRATTHFVSKYVAVSESDARFLITKKRVPAEKIAVINNGVDIERFRGSADARNKVRHELGFSEDDCVLILVARLHRGKGHRVLFEAMRQLANTHPSIQLICLGEGAEETELQSLGQNLGLSNRIRFMGYQPKVIAWFAAADINVLPSFYEGFPLTIIEAMAAGLPSIASNVGGIPEAIESGVSGILVPPGDSAKLADAIAFLSCDRESRVRMGSAAHVRVRQNFAFDEQIRRTEKLYLDLCAQSVTENARAAITAPLPKELHANPPIAVELRK